MCRLYYVLSIIFKMEMRRLELFHFFTLLKNMCGLLKSSMRIAVSDYATTEFCTVYISDIPARYAKLLSIK